jgi:hypothetical protein
MRFFLLPSDVAGVDPVIWKVSSTLHTDREVPLLPLSEGIEVVGSRRRSSGGNAGTSQQ